MNTPRSVPWLWLGVLVAGCSSGNPTPEAPRAEVDVPASTKPEVTETSPAPPSDGEPSPTPAPADDGPDCETPYREAEAECREQLAVAEADCDQMGDQCDRRLLPTQASCIELSGADVQRLMCRCQGRGDEEACQQLEAD